MISRKLITFSLAIAAVMLLGQNAVKAQDYGYRFGVGLGYSNYGYSNYGNRGFSSNSQVPYFALHPPVYYSEQIVRRPYGISPYAAPPGIIPTEMIVAPDPVVIVNPHVNPKEAEDLPAQPKKPKKPAQPKKPQPKKNDKKDGEVNAVKGDDSQVNIVIKNQFFVEQSPSAFVIK